MSDVTQAWRSLRRQPVLAAAAVLSLALGIGVNATIFSVFDRIVLRTLPVPAPEEIVVLSSPGRKPGGTSTGDSGGRAQVFSEPLFRDLERLPLTTLSRIAAHRDFTANLAFDGQTARSHGLLVSGGYFPALGVQPARGRLLTPDDERGTGGQAVAVITHRYWSTVFGGRADVIGKPVIVNGEPFTIVGVGPAGFTGNTTMDLTDVFVPLATAERLHTGSRSRRDHWLYLFARLQPGATRSRAQDELRGPFTALMRDAEYPEVQSELRADERAPFLARPLVVEEGSHYRSADRGEVTTLLALVFALTGLVLLIACANIANLLIARATDRSGELAVRLSLGASPSRLMRLLLSESLMLGLLGAAAGLWVAKATSALLLGMMPPEDVAALAFELNVPLVVFTIGLGVLAGLVFGAFPALQGRRTLALSRGHASTSRTTARFRSGLAMAQVTIATALLATGALFAATLYNLTRAELGFRSDGLVTFGVSPHLNGYTAERTAALHEQLTDNLRGLPGVTGVTAGTIPVLAGEGWDQRITVERTPTRAEVRATVNASRIDTGYFETLGVPTLRGRDFTSADGPRAPKVAIVNRAFVRQLGLGDDVLGRRVALGTADGAAFDITVVGLIADAKYTSMRAAAPPQLYLPYRQSPGGPLTFYVHTAGDVRAALAAIPPLVRRIDANVPVEHLRTVDDQIWESVTRERLLATLSGAFAVLAAILAGVGLYALLASVVAGRLKEFGIRMAMGASPGDVRRLVAAQVGRIAGTGTIAGLIGAFALSRAARSLLYGLDVANPGLIGAAALLMLLVATAAAAVPTRRATHVQPVAALREE